MVEPEFGPRKPSGRVGDPNCHSTVMSAGQPFTHPRGTPAPFLWALRTFGQLGPGCWGVSVSSIVPLQLTVAALNVWLVFCFQTGP